MHKIRMGVIVRILIAITFLAALNSYVAFWVLVHSPSAATHFCLFVGTSLCFFLIQLVAPFGDHLLFPRLNRRPGWRSLIRAIEWLSYVCFGALSCLFIYCLLLDIADIGLRLTFMPENHDETMVTLLGLLTIGTVVLGIRQVAKGPVIRHVNIPLTNLPEAFSGFKIVQVSDLHVGGITGRKETAEIVGAVNNLSPDLIALTGDFVDGSVEDLREEVAPLALLTAPYGKYFITGNHEYYWGAAAWVEEFKRLGAQVLLNAHAIIQRDKEAFILAGVTDYSTLHMNNENIINPQKSLQGAPSGLAKILLAHQPASYQMAEQAGFDLQLSGHTHGGQYFPFSFFIRFFQRYYKGLNRYKNMWIYVNTGTGFWGPPLRTAVPSEITVITLQRQLLI